MHKIKNTCSFNIHKIDFFLALNHYAPMLSRHGRSTFSYKSHDARSHMMLSHMRSCAILHRRCKSWMRDPASMKESCFLWHSSVQVQRAHVDQLKEMRGRRHAVDRSSSPKRAIFLLVGLARTFPFTKHREVDNRVNWEIWLIKWVSVIDKPQFVIFFNLLY